MPLVIFLNGYNTTQAFYDAPLNLAAHAEAMGFIYCGPSGVTDSTGRQFWNASEVCCDFYDMQVDDAGFLRSLILQISADYNVDRSRIHLCGHSNGGFMSFRMAREHPDMVASIASISGTMDDQSVSPPPDGPVSVLEIHGTADATVLYGGGPLGVRADGTGFPIRGRSAGARESVRRWAEWNGCGLLEDDASPTLDLVSSLAGLDTVVSRTSGCPKGYAVELWSITGGGHDISGVSKSFATSMLDWLLAHPKPN
jgi:polyhydroxybutyrate depolymerase